MFEIIGWILLTLMVATGSALVARRLGPEYLVALFAAMAVIANVLASAKLVLFFGFTVDAGTIVYGAMFLLTDMLCELYSKDLAKKAVWAGFLANLMLLVSVFIAKAWTPSPFWGGELAFETIFGNTWRIVGASLCAYLVSQHLDVWLYAKIKGWTKGKHLWLRNNLSTFVSQLFDTLIFVTLAFGGVVPIAGMIVGLYIAKVIIAVLDTPFIYFVRWYYGKPSLSKGL